MPCSGCTASLREATFVDPVDQLANVFLIRIEPKVVLRFGFVWLHQGIHTGAELAGYCALAPTNSQMVFRRCTCKALHGHKVVAVTANGNFDSARQIL